MNTELEASDLLQPDSEVLGSESDDSEEVFAGLDIEK